MVDGLPRAAGGIGTGTTDQQVALRDGIDLPVRAFERRHNQRAAAQALGVADGRDGDVNLLPGAGKGGQIRRDHHRGDVFHLQIRARRQPHAEIRQHVVHALHGKRRLRGLVARAVQPDH